MDKECLISVIIPALNEEELIKKTLKSYLVQKNVLKKHFEVIVVDNGSKDKTKKIIGKFAKAYKKLSLFLIIKPKKGVASASKSGMNEALFRAKAINKEGLIIARSGADTVVKPLLIKTLIDIFEKERCGAVCGDCFIRKDAIKN